MNAILSADVNWAIGCEGELLTRVPEDMKFFKSMTLGKVVVMGRKTFESLPGQKPLTNRINIILTRDKSYEAEGALVLHSVEDVLKEAQKYESEDVFVIGGGEIYEIFLPYCEKVYVTKFLTEFDADTYFPNLDADISWKLTKQSDEKHYNEMLFKFTTYENTGDLL